MIVSFQTPWIIIRSINIAFMFNLLRKLQHRFTVQITERTEITRLTDRSIIFVQGSDCHEYPGFNSDYCKVSQQTICANSATPHCRTRSWKGLPCILFFSLRLARSYRTHLLSNLKYIGTARSSTQTMSCGSTYRQKPRIFSRRTYKNTPGRRRCCWLTANTQTMISPSWVCTPVG